MSAKLHNLQYCFINIRYNNFQHSSIRLYANAFHVKKVDNMYFRNAAKTFQNYLYLKIVCAMKREVYFKQELLCSISNTKLY